MPKSRFQEIVFSALMVCVMVYGMICYNIAIAQGGLTNYAFTAAFHEFVFMAPIAFVLKMFVVSPVAGRTAARMVGPNPSAPFAMVAAVSAVTVQLMCPLMSFVATLIIKRPDASNFVATWLLTTALNLPMACFWQFFFAGPVVRRVFGALFSHEPKEKPEHQLEYMAANKPNRESVEA